MNNDKAIARDEIKMPDDNKIYLITVRSTMNEPQMIAKPTWSAFQWSLVNYSPPYSHTLPDCRADLLTKVQGCVARSDFHEYIAIVKYICTGVTGHFIPPNVYPPGYFILGYSIPLGCNIILVYTILCQCIPSYLGYFTLSVHYPRILYTKYTLSQYSL